MEYIDSVNLIASFVLWIIAVTNLLGACIADWRSQYDRAQYRLVWMIAAMILIIGNN